MNNLLRYFLTMSVFLSFSLTFYAGEYTNWDIRGIRNYLSERSTLKKYVKDVEAGKDIPTAKIRAQEELVRAAYKRVAHPVKAQASLPIAVVIGALASGLSIKAQNRFKKNYSSEQVTQRIVARAILRLNNAASIDEIASITSLNEHEIRPIIEKMILAGIIERGEKLSIK